MSLTSQTRNEALEQGLTTPFLSGENLPFTTATGPEGTISPTATKKSKDHKITNRDLLNFYSRWVEDSRFFGEVPEAIVADELATGDQAYDAQVNVMVDDFSGLVIATILHFIFKSHYKKVDSQNPLYRAFKTLATAGTQLGFVFADLRFLPQILSVALFSLVLGTLALPYWLYRRYFTNPETEYPNHDYRVGKEGWSKYAKTFLIFGLYLGEAVGNIVSFVFRGDYLRNIALFGAIGSVLAFLSGLIAVPLINKFYHKKLLSDKNDAFRNNYVRSGITFGVAVGSVIGFVLGSLLFPGMGSIAGMAVFAAFGSVIGGVTLGVYGENITLYIRKKWLVSEDTDNSWDYASRNSSYFFGFIGATIGFFIPVPGGSIVGAAIGTAIGSTVGWLAGFLVIHQARKISLEEHKAQSLPWTQRVANGTMVGSMVGATLGFVLGLAIAGPIGAVSGTALGFSSVAILGGLAYGLYDKTARTMLRLYYRYLRETPLPMEENTSTISPAPTTGSTQVIAQSLAANDNVIPNVNVPAEIKEPEVSHSVSSRVDYIEILPAITPDARVSPRYRNPVSISCRDSFQDIQLSPVTSRARFYSHAEPLVTEIEKDLRYTPLLAHA
jgi:hypothetical protein